VKRIHTLSDRQWTSLSKDLAKCDELFKKSLAPLRRKRMIQFIRHIFPLSEVFPEVKEVEESNKSDEETVESLEVSEDAELSSEEDETMIAENLRDAINTSFISGK